MNPALSVVVFTTAAGAAQGLVVALALALLAALPVGVAFVRTSLVVAVVLLLVGLATSFLHLGRPARAWRAVAMWRTSWLSREVIVLPAFIALVAGWWLALREPSWPAARALLPLAAIAVAALLWYCTAMIYACLRFIEEWAHPLTLVNFALLGLSSGLVLACALAAGAGDRAALGAAAPAATIITLLAWACRSAAWRRNAAIRHRSTLQSATGIHAPHLVQMSMGMSAGSFNTREFIQRASRAGLVRIRLVAIVTAYALPALSLALVSAGAVRPAVCLLALLVQAAGILADRWLFFAQAKHPQNLYYQVVS